VHARARSVHDESPNTEGANDGILPDFRGVGNRRREYQRRGRVPPPTNTMAADLLFGIVSHDLEIASGSAWRKRSHRQSSSMQMPIARDTARVDLSCRILGGCGGGHRRGEGTLVWREC
jgi:hypothetical protein